MGKKQKLNDQIRQEELQIFCAVIGGLAANPKVRELLDLHDIEYDRHRSKSDEFSVRLINMARFIVSGTHTDVIGGDHRLPDITY